MNVFSSMFTKSKDAESAQDAVVPVPETLEQILVELRTVDSEIAANTKSIRDFFGRGKDMRIGFAAGNIMVSVNALEMYPELRKLEHQQTKLLERRSSILARYAALKMEATNV